MTDPLPPGDPADAATPGDPANASTPDGAPTPRRYRTPDLDAPQYAIPAYAAPEPGDAAPGSPTAPPGGAYPVPGGRDSRPKALAIVALVLAGAGALLLFVGVGLGSGAGLLAPLLLLAAFVLSLVALLSRNQGGKGFGAGALVTSVLGGLVSVVVVVSVLGPFGTSSGDDVAPNAGDGYDDDASPGVAAPGTDGQPDPGAQFPTPQRPTVTETPSGTPSATSGGTSSWSTTRTPTMCSTPSSTHRRTPRTAPSSVPRPPSRPCCRARPRSSAPSPSRAKS